MKPSWGARFLSGMLLMMSTTAGYAQTAASDYKNEGKFAHCVQAGVNAAGFDAGSVDGQPGRKTATAVTAWALEQPAAYPDFSKSRLSDWCNWLLNPIQTTEMTRDLIQLTNFDGNLILAQDFKFQVDEGLVPGFVDMGQFGQTKLWVKDPPKDAAKRIEQLIGTRRKRPVWRRLPITSAFRSTSSRRRLKNARTPWSGWQVETGRSGG